MNKHRYAAICVGLLLLLTVSCAHRPDVSDGTGTDPFHGTVDSHDATMSDTSTDTALGCTQTTTDETELPPAALTTQPTETVALTPPASHPQLPPETSTDTEESTEITPPVETFVLTLPEPPTEAGAPETPEPAPETHAIDPIFSVPGGLLDGPTRVSLTLPADAPAGAVAVYTTDGSLPTFRSGTTYASEISVLDNTDCTVIRAAVFSSDGNQLGHTVTMTYMVTDISSLRVISLVTDPDNLYGPSGIFVDRSATGRAGERPVSVEIFEPGSGTVIRQDAAIRLAGAGSRTFDPANLRIIARKPEAFGKDAFLYSGRGKFHAQLFDGTTCDAYDSFLLRCGGNDSFHQARNDFLRMNMLRDAITNNICADAESLLGGTVFAQRSAPVAVYINGTYYGMLNMKQDFDENYIESVYGLPKAGIGMLKGKKDGKNMYYQVEAGTEQDLSDWQALLAYCVEHALADDYEEAYARVSEQLDVENFSRYYAVMLYLCNTDWPQNNTMIWRYTPTAGDMTEGLAYADGKWRAVIRDMDLCFALHDKASQTSSTTYSMADTDTFYRITAFYRDGNGYRYDPSLGLYDDAMGFQGLFDFLIRSADFRRMFREHCTALCSDEFAELCRAEIDRYYKLATPAIPAHLELWTSKGEIISDYTYRHFLDAKQDMLDFVRDRPSYFMQYMEKTLAYYEP